MFAIFSYVLKRAKQSQVIKKPKPPTASKVQAQSQPQTQSQSKKRKAASSQSTQQDIAKKHKPSLKELDHSRIAISSGIVPGDNEYKASTSSCALVH